MIVYVASTLLSYVATTCMHWLPYKELNICKRMPNLICSPEIFMICSSLRYPHSLWWGTKHAYLLHVVLESLWGKREEEMIL